MCARPLTLVNIGKRMEYLYNVVGALNLRLPYLIPRNQSLTTRIV